MTISSITLQNFRKFEKETTLFFNDLNVFVGKNNSGKSTMVKALMLAMDNIRFMEWENVPIGEDFFILEDTPRPYFRFDASHYHDLHIGSFRSAKTRNANNPNIVIEFQLDSAKVKITVSGSEDNLDSFRLPINRLEVSYSNKYFIDFNFVELTMNFSVISEANTEIVKDLKQQIAFINFHIKSAKELCKHHQNIVDEQGSYESAQSIASLNNQIKQLQSKKKKLQTELQKQENANHPIEIGLDLIYYHNPGKNILTNYLETIERLVNMSHEDSEANLIVKSSTTELTKTRKFINKEIQKVIKRQKAKLITYMDDYMEFVDFTFAIHWDFTVDYVPAHGAAQKRLFCIEDKNDYNARVVHEYYQELISAGSEIHEDLNKWLDIFEIGDSILVTPLEAEGYYVQVLKNGDFVHLADLGTGSCQMVILLLKLATVASRIKRHQFSHYWLIIEEPEQNLHPMLQSKLADLFDSFCESYADTVHVVIETHSEYLIRELQFLLVKADFKDREEIENYCSATVFYFPSSADQAPYDMKFLPNGMFERKFESGFFDEASNKYLQILKNAKKG